MLQISDLFKKIKNKHSKEVSLRMSIQTVIKKVTSMDIEIDSIIINSGNITLKNISQTAKNQIFVKKPSILEEVNKTKIIPRIENIN